ncbi:hypothetical protein RRF57_008076 [Xylaria bambusicola]|uniref:Hemerythrin-like domain-containing protein n=1 Tax=Xylaria bambusicola TaxID=326684 RepID=A0AAN7Z7Z3_9PEZI
MTTKSSPTPWVDGPFSLIETPSVKIKSDHFYLKAASEMTHAHNVLIRSLNAILRQGPHIPTSTDPKYCAKDVTDFLNYVRCWVQMVHHHHWVEEEFIFPEMDKFSGKPGLMDEPRHQHELFQAGLTNLESYSINTKPEKFEWKGAQGMEHIIDSFSEDLTGHLYGEIEVLLTLSDLDSEEFKKTWLKAETIAKQSGNLKLLACGEDFPPFPWFMPYLAHYAFAVRNGSWRFNPCDFWGKPRPLAFVNNNASED